MSPEAEWKRLGKKKNQGPQTTHLFWRHSLGARSANQRSRTRKDFFQLPGEREANRGLRGNAGTPGTWRQMTENRSRREAHWTRKTASSTSTTFGASAERKEKRVLIERSLQRKFRMKSRTPEGPGKLKKKGEVRSKY